MIYEQRVSFKLLVPKELRRRGRGFVKPLDIIIGYVHDIMEYRAICFSKEGIQRFSISLSDFEEARQKKNVVVELLSLEERFNILLENYAEFERELLDLTLDEALSFGGEWNTSIDKLHVVNRRLVNLLTTCKLYLDQLQHSLSDLVGNDHDVTTAVKKKTSEAYDSRFGYRVMEALRNHVQHRGLPVHTISFQGKWNEDRSIRRHRTTITLDPQRLADDPKFKKSVFREMQQKSEELNLKPLARDYLSGIISVHLHVREQLSDFRKRCDEGYKRLIAAYQPDGEAASTIRLHAIDDDGSRDSEFSLFEDLIERRHQLERKNRSFGDLTDLVITSQ